MFYYKIMKIIKFYYLTNIILKIFLLFRKKLREYFINIFIYENIILNDILKQKVIFLLNFKINFNYFICIILIII